jgi:N-acetylmuramoyl-L-alanine amidase
LAYITPDKGKKEIAGALANAIVSFFKSLDAISGDEPQAESVVEEVAASSEPQSQETELDEGYAIQLISSTYEVDTRDYQFKSYKGRVRLLMGTGRYKYKYCYGSYATRDAAKRDLAEVQKTFKDAYIVRYKDGNIVTQ